MIHFLAPYSISIIPVRVFLLSSHKFSGPMVWRMGMRLCPHTLMLCIGPSGVTH